MAQIVVIVDVPDTTAEELIRAAAGVEDLGNEPTDIDGWDVLAMIWGGDLEQFRHVVVADRITDDMPKING